MGEIILLLREESENKSGAEGKESACRKIDSYAPTHVQSLDSLAVSAGMDQKPPHSSRGKFSWDQNTGLQGWLQKSRCALLPHPRQPPGHQGQ